jgi:beta-aspartyl-dipeptidase (metallo-type)
MLTLLTNADVYAPEPLGRVSVLLANDRIELVGTIDAARIGVECEVLDASGCVVIPGLIDPHEHLIGGSGEKGFATQPLELTATEVARGGITTVVGCLGVDSTTKTPAALLAKVKAFEEEGLTARMWSGGYDLPPATLTGSIRRDLLLVAEVIGAGEIAICDHRALEPEPRELARLAIDCYAAGTLTGKAGVLHLHAGDGERRLAVIREVLDGGFEVRPESLYVTHVERNRPLMEEAIEISKRGVAVDLDVVEDDLAEWLPFYLDGGGDPSLLTVSTDASIQSPSALLEQLRRCVRDARMPLERVLPFATTNTARILKLRDKGRIARGAAADLVVLQRDSLELVHVFARGRQFVRGGEVVVRERFREGSKR